MKKLLAIFVIFIMVVMVAVACHRGGGDEGPGPISNEPVVPGPGPGPQPGVPDVVFTTPTDAAASTAALSGTQALARAQFAVASSLGVASQQRTGFAPSLSGSGDIGSVDPEVAKIVQIMKNFANSATIQRAVKKAAALRAKAMLATVVPPTTLAGEACAAGGKIDISGTNTYNDLGTNVDSSYDLIFTNCRDDFELSQLDGTLHIEQFASTVNDGVASTVVAKDLTQTMFTDDLFAVKTLTSVMTGTFIKDDQVTKVTDFADGSFTMTTTATSTLPEKVGTFEFQGLEEVITLVHNADLTNTKDSKTQGTFKVTSTSGGTQILQMNLAMNLTESELIKNDQAGTRENKLNGTVDMIFANNPATAGCLSGKLNITTADAEPRVFTNAGGTCPSNGTVTINSATINYEPNNAPIQVSAAGTVRNFANCAELDAAGGACKF